MRERIFEQSKFDRTKRWGPVQTQLVSELLIKMIRRYEPEQKIPQDPV